jgi:hypothetical protein
MEERRSAERRVAQFPVTLSITGPVALTGRTLNLSRSGLLLEAQGRIPVTITLEGTRYTGFLVRALLEQRGEENAITIAIQLVDTLPAA